MNVSRDTDEFVFFFCFPSSSVPQVPPCSWDPVTFRVSDLETTGGAFIGQRGAVVEGIKKRCGIHVRVTDDRRSVPFSPSYLSLPALPLSSVSCLFIFASPLLLRRLCGHLLSQRGLGRVPRVRSPPAAVIQTFARELLSPC